MKPILFTCLIALVFASCTGRRYGHYGYVKKGEKKEVTKEDKKQPIPTAFLAAKRPGISAALVQVDTQAARKTTVICRKNNEPENTIRKTNIKQQRTNDPPKQKERRFNINSILSILATALSVAFLIGPGGINLVFWLVAFILAFVGLITGIKSLAEIKKNKELGTVLAILSIVTSIAVLSFIVTVIGLVLLIFGIIIL